MKGAHFMVNSVAMSLKERFQRLLQWMYTPVDGSSMAFFRFGYGAIMLWEVTRYFDHNWIKSYYTGKDFYFTYAGFGWVHPWPSLELMEAHFIFMGILGFMIMVGFLYRFAATAMFFAFSYVFLLEQARYLNHFYFVILVAFTMIFVPAHRYFSVDAWIKKRFSGYPFLKKPSQYMDNWAVWAVKMQFAITYFYGGIAKLNVDWLQGYPLSDWIKDEKDVPFIGPYVHEYWMGLSLSYAGLLIDLLIVPLLLWRKTRWIGLFLALAFNYMNDQMFSIGIFPITMVAGTTLFMDPDWPKKVYDFCIQETVQKWKAQREKRRLALQKHASTMPTTFTRAQKLLAGFMVFFFAYQFLFPFRHWLYPGSVHWTEEGHAYSWHMKLRSKRGRIKFTVKDPDSGQQFTVDPDDYLNNRQEKKMASRPMMALQFVHWLRDKYHEEGMPNVEIYAKSTAALNGRKRQEFIDGSVDLAKEEWSLFGVDWIVPLYTTRESDDDE